MGTAHFTPQITDIHPTDIPNCGPQTDFDIFRIPLQLDSAAISDRLQHVKNDFEWKTKDDLSGYKALGLQYSNGPHVYTESVDSLTSRPFLMYEKRNPAADHFDQIFRRLLPLRLFRTRLLTIGSGFEMKDAHSDGAAAVRLHIPIETNPKAWMEIGERRYHLPADGSAYLVNTSRMHRIGNGGPTARTHFVSIIYPGFPSLIHPIAQNAMIRFIEVAGKGRRANLVILIEAALIKAEGRCEACKQAWKLYGVPISQTELMAACAQCIESAGRRSGDVDQFQTELERSISSRV